MKTAHTHSEHTPGPWSLSAVHHGGHESGIDAVLLKRSREYAPPGEDTTILAIREDFIRKFFDEDSHEFSPNARLIGAAPEIYDALELLLCFEAGDDSKAAIAARNKGRKALAQAKAS